MISKFHIFENREIWNDFFNRVERGEYQKDPADIKNISKLQKLIPEKSDVLSRTIKQKRLSIMKVFSVYIVHYFFAILLL